MSDRWTVDHADYWDAGRGIDLRIVTAPMLEIGWEPFAIENIMKRAQRQATDPKTPLEDIAAVWSEPKFGKRVWFKRLAPARSRVRPAPKVLLAQKPKKKPKKKAKRRGG